MKIMITGAGGVVGKELSSLLTLNKNYEIFLLSNSNIKNKNKRKLKIIKHDLTKPLISLYKIDVLIHCAAKNPLSKTGKSMTNIFKKNIQMTKNLIHFANEKNIKKIIFLSSMDVYGNIKNKNVLENQKKIQPSLYGKSKFFSEKLFSANSNKFKTISLRIPGIFSQDISRNGPLITNIVKKMIKNEDVHIYNFDKQFNNIADPQELARFIKFIIYKKFAKSEVYNFSASKPLKFIQVINLIKRILKSKSKIFVVKKKERSFTISNKKLQKDFNFKITSTENIIKRNCKKIYNQNLR
tara:strand:- start:4914 stop:5804 length:891 start_codon:yes stop_codon:yes gene_type:complete